jgi:hypothetical protein
MQRALWILSGLLLVASCGEDVPVGGRDDVTNDGDGDPATGDGDGDGDGDDNVTDDGDPATDDGDDDPATDDGDDPATDGGTEECREQNGQTICPDDPADDDDDPNPNDPIDEAISHAADDVRCQDDSDCCVVVDQCRGIGLVVWPQDQPSVRELVDSAGQVECVQCGPTYVQVTCQQNVCVGTSVTPSPISNGPNEDPLAMDHCGAIQSSSQQAIDSGHVLGCGIDDSGSGR